MRDKVKAQEGRGREGTREERMDEAFTSISFISRREEIAGINREKEGRREERAGINREKEKRREEGEGLKAG